MKTKKYLGICRNYYFKELDSYCLIISQENIQKKDFIDYLFSIGLEPMKIIKLKGLKEMKLYSTYSPLTILNPFKNYEKK